MGQAEKIERLFPIVLIHDCRKDEEALEVTTHRIIQSLLAVIGSS